MTKYEIESFSYVKNFKCIGPACPDTCCSGGWNIVADQEIMDLYKEKAPDLLDTINFDTINKNNNILILDQDGTCICYDEDKLCNIQKKYGEEYLSDTCKIYPRLIKSTNDKFITSATFSCPEIVRLALFQEKNPFEILQYDTGKFLDKYLDKYIKKDRNANIHKEMEINDKMFVIIHEFLTNTNLSAEEILVIFNSIFVSLNYIRVSDSVDALKFYLETITDRPLIDFETNYENIFSILFVMLFEINNSNKVFRDLILRLTKELGIEIPDFGRKTELVFTAKSIAKFKAKQKIWGEYTESSMAPIYKRIASHYLLSLDNLLCSSGDPMLLIVFKFVLFKIFMISLVDKNGYISEADIVSIVESISRVLDHKQTVETILMNLKDMKIDSETKILGLIQTVTNDDLRKNFATMIKEKKLVKI